MTSKLYKLRRDLKIRIYHLRRLPGQQSPCPICKKEIKIEGGADMHEVFFTRGDVQGIRAEEERYLVFFSCNVVLVHNGECHLKAQHTLEGKRACAEHIIFWSGHENVQRYIDSMSRIVMNKLEAVHQLGFVDGIAAQMPAKQPQAEPRWQF